MSGLGNRLKSVREHLGETQKSMCDRLGLGVNTWQSYERFDRMPKGETLEQLSELGFSIDWLLTGKGQMLQNPYGYLAESPAPFVHAPGPDPKIFRAIVDGLNGLFRELNQKVGPGQLAERAAEIYPEIAAIADETERRGALAYAVAQVRKELLRAAAGEVTSKQSA